MQIRPFEIAGRGLQNRPPDGEQALDFHPPSNPSALIELPILMSGTRLFDIGRKLPPKSEGVKTGARARLKVQQFLNRSELAKCPI